jgi:hypothetical protein
MSFTNSTKIYPNCLWFKNLSSTQKLSTFSPNSLQPHTIPTMGTSLLHSKFYPFTLPHNSPYRLGVFSRSTRPPTHPTNSFRLASEQLSALYVISSSLSFVGLVFSSSFRSKLWFPQYFEVFKSDFFQVISTNFMWSFYSFLHTFRFHGLPASIHRSQSQQRTSPGLRMFHTHRQISSPTRWRPFVIMRLSTNLLRFDRLLTMVWPPQIMYCGLCFCFLCSVVSGFSSCFFPVFTPVLVFWVFVAQTTPRITCTNNSKYWHPCHDSFSPRLPKHLGCSDFVCCFFFL